MSNIAKGGFNEEQFLCDNHRKFIPFLNNKDIDSKFSRTKDNSKTDICDENNSNRCQVKKFKDKQKQQVDRHDVDDFESKIKLGDCIKFLKGLCEIPLKEDGIYVDKSKGRINLSTKNYKEEELVKLIDILNKKKIDIINFALLGNNINKKPTYLIGSRWVNKKRNNLVIFKYDDIISSLSKFNFKIKPSKTVIELGESGFTLQRKGGDNGKKSSNQLQINIIISKLIQIGIKHNEVEL